MIAGAIMLVLGPAMGAGSSVVFLDAHDQSVPSKRIVEYTVGGVMAAAGAAIAISGVVLLRKGIRRHREDVEMGLTVGAARADLRVRF
jgi:hypothetical protein